MKYAGLKFQRKEVLIGCTFVRLLVAACTSLGASSSYGQQRIPSIEAVTSTCPFLQEFFADLSKEFMKPDRKTDDVSQDVLKGLTSASSESVEGFLRCFRAVERPLKQTDVRIGIIRHAAVTLHIVTSKVKVATRPDPIEVRGYVILQVWQRQGGKVDALGTYHVEPR